MVSSLSNPVTGWDTSCANGTFSTKTSARGEASWKVRKLISSRFKFIIAALERNIMYFTEETIYEKLNNQMNI